MKIQFTRWLPSLLLALALPGLAQAAQAASSAAEQQTSTASAHAGMALGAADLKATRMHLHHVINCIAGPSGAGFDAQAGNPCKDQGQGAVVDAKGDAALESKLRTALGQAEQGLQAATLEAAHAQAQGVLTTLQAK